ncbi:MAG: hypothetical protein KDA89_02550, partial [Planctomycetaceae bacterium]|nr:hypothetical protein [Planctomycetaceae bacterium]
MSSITDVRQNPEWFVRRNAAFLRSDRSSSAEFPPERNSNAAPQPLGSESVVDWILLLLAVSVPLCLSVLHLPDELWYDEAVTVETFASQPIVDIADSYPFPNNHVFFSMLLRPFYLFAPAPYILRLLPLLCTLGTLWLTYKIGTYLGGRSLAVCATAMLGQNQVFLNYTMQLRGYTLSMFLASLLLYLLLTAHPRRSRLFTIALAGTAVIYTLPTNIALVVSCGMVAALQSGRHSSGKRPVSKTQLRAILPWVLACVCGTICYLPILEELRAVKNQSTFSGRLLWDNFAEFLVSAIYD